MLKIKISSKPNKFPKINPNEQTFSLLNRSISISPIISLPLYINITFESMKIPKTYYFIQDDAFPLLAAYNGDYHYKGVDWTYEGILKAFSNDRSISYVLMEDVYVGYNSAFSAIKRPHFKRTSGECQDDVELTDTNSNFRGTYDLCIGYVLSSFTNFGHFNLDVFPFLAHLPEGLLKDAYILSIGKARFQKDYFQLLNIPLDHIISLDSHDYVFARRFITTIPLPCMTKSFYLHAHTRNIFVKKFNLDKKKPFRYVIMIRNDHRRVINANFTEKIKAEFSEQNREILEFKESLEETAKYFNEVALLSYVDGSGGANGLFMQAGSVVCPIQPVDYDPSFDIAFVGIGIHLIAIRYQTLTIKKAPRYPVAWHLIHNQIETALEILKRTLLKE